jgi:hypothetical protein
MFEMFIVLLFHVQSKNFIGQNYCVFEFYPLPCLLDTREHSASEAESVSMLR